MPPFGNPSSVARKGFLSAIHSIRRLKQNLITYCWLIIEETVSPALIHKRMASVNGNNVHQDVRTSAVVNQCIDYVLNNWHLQRALPVHREVLVVPDSVFFDMTGCLRENGENWMADHVAFTLMASGPEVRRAIEAFGRAAFVEPEMQDVTLYLAFCALYAASAMRARGPHWLQVLSRWISEVLARNVLPWLQGRGGWAGYFRFCEYRCSGRIVQPWLGPATSHRGQ